MSAITTTIDISGNLEAALRGMKPAAMIEATQRGMSRGLVIVSGLIQKERLTGEGPFPVADKRLGVKSGRLRQSVRATPAKVNGLEVTGSIGTRVVYAAAHEFGFKGTVKVAAHERTIKKKGGKRLKKAERTSHPVKAHQRVVSIPERAPFRTGITEHLDVFETEISREVTNGMKGQ